MLSGYNLVQVILFSPLSVIEGIAVTSFMNFPGKVKNVEVYRPKFSHWLSFETGFCKCFIFWGVLVSLIFFLIINYLGKKLVSLFTMRN